MYCRIQQWAARGVQPLEAQVVGAWGVGVRR